MCLIYFPNQKVHQLKTYTYAIKYNGCTHIAVPNVFIFGPIAMIFKWPSVH